MGIGARLKSERLRLGLTQTMLGAAGGVEVNAQGRYEAGVRIPRADYLASIAKVGIDVLYVVTGQRMQNRAADFTGDCGLPPVSQSESKIRVH
ncbi:XRE family transcriptional regulator [Pseudomonas sp. KBW05]|nr:XRE family transcriptional regulator [Pseudomonas sp. KBW05]